MSSQSLIVDLQLALSQAGTYSHDRLEQLATVYAQACENANSRLAKAVTYLRRGYRSEAIRLCEIEPNLLEEVNTLNFAGRSTWLQIAQQLHTVTPELLLNMAVEISEAYDMHERTKDLAAQLRQQAVRREEIEERIATLEQLQQADPNNPVWQQSLKEARGG